MQFLATHSPPKVHTLPNYHRILRRLSAALPAAGDVFIHVPAAQDEPIKKDSHPCWDKVKDAAATTTTVIVNKYEEAKKKGHVKRLKDAAKIVKNKAVEAYNEIK